MAPEATSRPHKNKNRVPILLLFWVLALPAAALLLLIRHVFFSAGFAPLLGSYNGPFTTAAPPSSDMWTHLAYLLFNVSAEGVATWLFFGWVPALVAWINAKQRGRG